MTLIQLIKYYGSLKNACDAVNRTRAMGTYWRNKGLPLKVQREFEKATNGDLKATARRVKA